jgi:hypothetical protein
MITRIAATMATGRRERRPLHAHVDEREDQQQDQADRRDPDRGEDHRLRPLEDPQQVEEEVEVPVGRGTNEVVPGSAGAPITGPRSSEPSAVYFQMTASATITQTTTRLMTVSWNIAYG